jgi:hypothetical protein
MVGLVRWMRIGTEGRVDAGIELLSRRARAASLRPLDGPVRTPSRALWLDLPVDAHPVRPAPGSGRVLTSSSIDRAVGSFELRRAPGVHPGHDGPDASELVDWPRHEVASAFVLIGPPAA